MHTGIISDDMDRFVQRGIQVGAHKHAGAAQYSYLCAFFNIVYLFDRYFARRDGNDEVNMASGSSLVTSFG